jgi:hypothetical protein
MLTGSGLWGPDTFRRRLRLSPPVIQLLYFFERKLMPTSETVKPYRDPVPGRGSIELRRTAAGVYSWVITIWTDAIVTDNHLLGMVESVDRVDAELRKKYPEPN